MYRLGLLACDFMPDNLSDRFDDYPDMFARALALTGKPVQWRVYRAYAEELPAAPDECDGYITTGSRSGAYDGEPWIAALERFIVSLIGSGRPLVGICFGHQLIAQALGGRVERSPRGWGIGLHEYDILASQPWMTPPRARFTVPVCHQDQVTALPPGAIRVARSDHCENFVIHFNDTMIGIQGHPEFERDYIGVLLEQRRDLIVGPTRDGALASLTRNHDNAIVMAWIAAFLALDDPQSAAH